MMEPIHEEEEESFVLNALCTAASDGSASRVAELLDKTDKVTVDSTNRAGETLLHVSATHDQLDVAKLLHERGADLKLHDKKGDSAVHTAARHGSLNVLQFLAVNGQSLNQPNASSETPAHLAARSGHAAILAYLASLDIDVNAQDKLGDTALHICTWNNMHPSVILQLCKAGAKPDLANKEGETVLHVAASRGHVECAYILLAHGAKIDAQDQRGSTALHLACRRSHVGLALLLLHAQCALDIQDATGESPLHPAARDGLLPVVQTMCAFGCRVDIANNTGMLALHLASRAGHVEVVRCLLLSGADPSLLNTEGVTAEMMAIAQGEMDVATLLNQSSAQRDTCVRQLMPGTTPLSRVKVKVFGSSGVGKTILIDSLKCGYFGSFFRKSRLMSASAAKTTGGSGDVASNGSGTPSTSTPPMSPAIPDRPARPPSLQTQVSFENAQYSDYTRGISAQQINASGVGDLSVWEFSGFEPYYLLYDLFIGDPNCVHVVVFSCEDPPDVQVTQVLFWLHFLKARLAPLLPVATGGSQPWPAKLLLVATHADTAGCGRNSKGEFVSEAADMVLKRAREELGTDFEMPARVIVVDAHLAMSAEFKVLRNSVAALKEAITRSLPVPNSFLYAVVSGLPAWRKMTSSLPVVTWPNFISYVRSKVNMLASEDHLKELMCQLQLCGEVVYVESEGEHDLVVLDPNWLGSSLLGGLLSRERLASVRPTGVFMATDLELSVLMPEVGGLGAVTTLEALELCTGCELEGDVEYEFPCFNMVETIEGLWEPDTEGTRLVYGGVRLCLPPGTPALLIHIFPRVQVALRRDFLQNHNSADCDLYQWRLGAKYCSGALEGLVTVERAGAAIDLKCRGPESQRSQLFYFFEDVFHIIMDSLSDMCPGLGVQRYLLSPAHLATHPPSLNMFFYTPIEALLAKQNGSSSIRREDGQEEPLADVICFGAHDVLAAATIGLDLHIGHLNVHARRRLCACLDPADPMGRDWCLLAVSLGLTEALPQLDAEPPKNFFPSSKTDRALEAWSRDPKSTIGSLLSKLQELGRSDATEALLMYAPIFHIFQDNNSNVEKVRNEGGPENAGCKGETGLR